MQSMVRAHRVGIALHERLLRRIVTRHRITMGRRIMMGRITMGCGNSDTLPASRQRCRSRTAVSAGTRSAIAVVAFVEFAPNCAEFEQM